MLFLTKYFLDKYESIKIENKIPGYDDIIDKYIEVNRIGLIQGIGPFFVWQIGNYLLYANKINKFS